MTYRSPEDRHCSASSRYILTLPLGVGAGMYPLWPSLSIGYGGRTGIPSASLHCCQRWARNSLIVFHRATLSMRWGGQAGSSLCWAWRT